MSGSSRPPRKATDMCSTKGKVRVFPLSIATNALSMLNLKSSFQRCASLTSSSSDCCLGSLLVPSTVMGQALERSRNAANLAT